MGADEELLLQLGLSESKVKETIKNATLTNYLKQCTEEHFKVTGKLTPSPEDRKVAVLIYSLASKLKASTEKYLPFVLQYIIDKKIDNDLRLSCALNYLLDHLQSPTVNIPEFETHCGIGVTVTAEEIEHAVHIAIQKFKTELLQSRYQFNVGRIMAEVKAQPKMGWADGVEVKAEVELGIKLLLGPKTAEDFEGAGAGKVSKSKSTQSQVKSTPAKGKKENANANSNAMSSNSNVSATAPPPQPPQDSYEKIASILKKLPFHKPGANYTAEGYPNTEKAMDLLNSHSKRINGQVRTRFPPEPNGILHIGHAKAININFGYAKVNDGVCFLRYDDTNPEKEEERFFTSILDMVQWLGYSPYKVTHASDYFTELYEWALVLIKQGLAYVCHQKAEDMKGFNPPPSPWRDRPVQENYHLFEDMKNGLFDEGAATLRMKITLEEGKQDPVAYRVRFLPHPRTGDKWCIYPTYDFTHCLCDSVEDITHSLCTKEFQNRRSSYYWLCEAVSTYIPVQWEYGRLNLSYTVVSKRKIAKLIEENIVKDWDDPRLFTLPALRRRGFPPEALNEFCVRMGITGAQITAEPAMLEACVREVLNLKAPRTMVVLNPIRVVIENGENLPSNLNVPDIPGEDAGPSHSIAFDSVIYIDRADFREKTEKGYKRFAADQSVGLRYANLILKCKDVIKDANGVTEIKVTAHAIGSVDKPKGFIHWVAKPVTVEIRIYERLFQHKNPEDKAQVPNGFLSDTNRDSLFVEEGLADAHLLRFASSHFKQFQFERMGFFCVDPDSLDNKLVFNRTVSLKEDTGKN